MNSLLYPAKISGFPKYLRENGINFVSEHDRWRPGMADDAGDRLVESIFRPAEQLVGRKGRFLSYDEKRDAIAAAIQEVVAPREDAGTTYWMRLTGDELGKVVGAAVHRVLRKDNDMCRDQSLDSGQYTRGTTLMGEELPEVAHQPLQHGHLRIKRARALFPRAFQSLRGAPSREQRQERASLEKFLSALLAWLLTTAAGRRIAAAARWAQAREYLRELGRLVVLWMLTMRRWMMEPRRISGLVPVGLALVFSVGIKEQAEHKPINVVGSAALTEVMARRPTAEGKSEAVFVMAKERAESVESESLGGESVEAPEAAPVTATDSSTDEQDLKQAKNHDGPVPGGNESSDPTSESVREVSEDVTGAPEATSEAPELAAVSPATPPSTETFEDAPEEPGEAVKECIEGICASDYPGCRPPSAPNRAQIKQENTDWLTLFAESRWDTNGIEFCFTDHAYYSFYGKNLDGSKLRSLGATDLSGASLRGATLEGGMRARFDRVDLTKARIKNVQLWKASLRKSILVEADLSGSDLSGASLAHSDLSFALLVSSNLSGVDLTGADLTGANLRHAIYTADTVWPEGFDYQISGAIGPGANIHGANLDFKDLSDLDMSDSKMDSVSFRRANLSRSNFKGADIIFSNLQGSNLSGTVISEADLSGSDLYRSNLSGADLTDTKLNQTNFRGARLTGANLSGADLTGADLTGADLTGADLTGADLTGADLTGADLTGADFTGTNTAEAVFRAAKFSTTTVWPPDYPFYKNGAVGPGVDLRGADLSGANLQGYDLQGADMEGTNLYSASLRGADLTDANLKNSNLSEADLSNANLTGADLTGALVTNTNMYGAYVRKKKGQRRARRSNE